MRCAARGHALAIWLRLVPRRPNALRPAQQINLLLILRIKCCAWAERVFTPSGARAERGRWSEEIKNREGVASGSATQFFLINYNYLTFIILFFLWSNPILIFLLDVVIDLEFNSRICTLFCINVIAKKHCNKQMPFWIKIRIY